jgi:hypothetical protein
MRKLTITFLTIVFCLTSSIAFSKTVAPTDLVERNGITYKKFSNKPYSGSVEGADELSLSVKGTYRNGKRDGLWEAYWDNGQLRYIRTYKNGVSVGDRESYYKNGKLWMKGTYKDGKKDGVVEWYHENGRLVKKFTYKNGELIKEEKF